MVAGRVLSPGEAHLAARSCHSGFLSLCLGQSNPESPGGGRLGQSAWGRAGPDPRSRMRDTTLRKSMGPFVWFSEPWRGGLVACASPLLPSSRSHLEAQSWVLAGKNLTFRSSPASLGGWAGRKRGGDPLSCGGTWRAGGPPPFPKKGRRWASIWQMLCLAARAELSRASCLVPGGQHRPEFGGEVGWLQKHIGATQGHRGREVVTDVSGPVDSRWGLGCENSRCAAPGGLAGGEPGWNGKEGGGKAGEGRGGGAWVMSGGLGAGLFSLTLNPSAPASCSPDSQLGTKGWAWRCLTSHPALTSQSSPCP